jgi:CBS domain-containing protein
MFSVYGVTGRQFTGSAEQLRQIERVNATPRTRRVDANESELPGRVSADPSSTPSTATPRRAAQQALAAYAPATAHERQRQPLMRVADIQSSSVLSLTPDVPVLQAWRQLDYHGHAQAPVVNAQGVLVGLLLRADLLRADRLAMPDLEPAAWQRLMQQPIGDLMWTPVPSVTADTDIRRVASVLHDNDLPGLPVVNEFGHVTGMVTRGDILRAVANDPPLDLWG